MLKAAAISGGAAGDVRATLFSFSLPPEYSGKLPVLFVNHVQDPDKLWNKKKKSAASCYYWVPADCRSWAGPAADDEANGIKDGCIGSSELDALYDPAASKQAAGVYTLSIKGRGSSTWTDWNKKPFKLSFDKKMELLAGTAASKEWALMPWCFDTETGFLVNLAGHKISELAGLPWTPDAQPVELMIDGEYYGLYFLVESIRPSKNRVDILDISDYGKSDTPVTPDHWHNWIVQIDQTLEATDAEFKYGQTVPSEFNVHISSEAPEIGDLQDFVSTGSQDFASHLTDPNVAKGYIEDFATDLGIFRDAVANAKGSWCNNGWSETIDPKMAAKFVVVQELMEDYHGYTTNFYMHKGDYCAEKAQREMINGCLAPFGISPVLSGMKARARNMDSSIPVLRFPYCRKWPVTPSSSMS